MRYTRIMSLAFFLLFQTTAALADTQHITVSDPFDALATNIDAYVTKPTAEINNDAQGAEGIMDALVDKSKLQSRDLTTDKNFYCIFHLLKWTDPDANGNQTVQAQNWYLYHGGRLTAGSATTIPRLFGAREAVFVYIHFNKDPNNNYKPLYKFDIEQRTPAYLGDLLGVLGLASSQGGNKAAAQPKDWFGVTTLKFQYRVADITATPKLTRNNSTVEDMGT